MSTTRPGDEPEDPDEPGERGERGDDAGAAAGDRGRPQPESPLDDLFVVGAKYHEPSAAERAAAAKAAERDAKKAAKAHDKEIARTRRVLGGDNKRERHGRGFSVASFERRNALIGFVLLVAISVALSFTAFAH